MPGTGDLYEAVHVVVTPDDFATQQTAGVSSSKAIAVIIGRIVGVGREKVLLIE